MSLLYFKKVTPSHPDLPAVIRLSIGNPTPEKVQKVLGLYETSGHYLTGSFEADTLIGVMGFEVQRAKAIIKHIAILPEYQLQGVGKTFIEYLIDHFPLQIIHAETDDDAVDFYKKVGFICQPFEGHYGKRYKCDYKR